VDFKYYPKPEFSDSDFLQDTGTIFYWSGKMPLKYSRTGGHQTFSTDFGYVTHESRRSTAPPRRRKQRGRSSCGR